MSTTPVTVAILGGGTVGAQVARLIEANASDLSARIGAPLQLTGVAVRDASRSREGVPAGLLTGDAAGLAASGADIVVEVMGGIEPARTLILDAIAQGGSSRALGGVALTTEQLTRLLDGLREGEGSVKLGLSEKVNLEVTLLKAVEASRARAIDSLLKELASLADESPAAAGDEKKKG